MSVRPRNACRIGESGGTVIRHARSRIPAITWHEPGGRVPADPGATLALDRTAWERLGARFAPVDDGQGETPGLATASLSTDGGQVTVAFSTTAKAPRICWCPGDGTNANRPRHRCLQRCPRAAPSDSIEISSMWSERWSHPSLEQRVAELEQRVRVSMWTPTGRAPQIRTNAGPQARPIIVFQGNVDDRHGGNCSTGNDDVSRAHAKVTYGEASSYHHRLRRRRRRRAGPAAQRWGRSGHRDHRERLHTDGIGATSDASPCAAAGH